MPGAERQLAGEERPADVVRRALQVARERGGQGVDAEVAGPPESSRAPRSPHAPGADRTAVDKASEPQARPGDAARAALRRAVAERRAVGAPGEDAHASGDGPAQDAGASSPGGSSGEGTADGLRDPVRSGAAVPDAGVGETGEAERSGDATGDESAGLPNATILQDSETVQEPATVADGGSTRPADAAREALRAARGAARKAREDVGARGVEPVSRPAARAGAGSEGRRGMRSGAGEAGARELRDFLAGAFRLPADVTEPDDVTSAAEEAVPDNDPATPGSSHSEAFTSTSVHASGVSARTSETPAHTPDRTDPPSHSSLIAPDSTSAPVLAPDPDLTPAPPRTPTSMASPSRDSDLRRTFPAFSPRPSDRDKDKDGGGAANARFADTWWGNAWVTALEEGALDPKRLLRGRSYAEKGHVDAITVTPGLVLGYVQGSRARPYRVQVRLRTLDDADWERFLDAAADRPGHIAALLDKEMPKSLAECGVSLLPGPGDLAPQCSCPDSGHPCKHAAALCYQTARLLDADPFVLLLLRGRGERPLLDALSRRSAARAARAAQEQEPAPLPGVRATDVLAEQGKRRLPPLPPPLPMPPHPEQPPVYPAAPGGPDPFALDQLATDAAARAHALLSTGRDPVGGLTLWQDAVRLAAARPGSGLTVTTRSLYASLAKATGRTTAELARAVAAWRQGGIEGLAVLEEPWDPPAGRFDRARPLLLAADLPAFRPWHNHLTHPHGHVQLRLGRDGLWYAYESEPGDEDWWPRGTPDLDPVGALTGLGAPSEL
ncbi:SWIM zinc finger family protein [Streptomyces sp. NBC_01288]|uniref:SWIM zinc finger family protein n=1 Tax=Streptomyces sp. NBC_01288 TaxID=2903814 RepID=UPI002E1015DF|nr:SWIM zinc finger family protein [Streptomyces sp. NBC_01288]